MKKVPRKKRSELLAEQIRQLIVEREMRPGDSLPNEAELVETSGCSRTVVREALASLQMQGIISVHPGKFGGARVSKVEYDQTQQALRSFFLFDTLSWQDIYLVRRLIEPTIAGLAVGRLSEAHLARLVDTIAICQSAIDSRTQSVEQKLAEIEFHSVLTEVCPNGLLKLIGEFILDLLRDLVRKRNVVEFDTLEMSRTIVHEHELLLAAFRSRDADRVRALMADHIIGTGCLMVEREEAALHRNVIRPSAVTP